ncbi:monogalactosyldiacylglycerol synthase [Thermincola ferriacetica]|uniref:Monogalactosyldiacylglycerol synthase n=1 Tax=Thermincola ferriacetica TaxID=281456 RepID=A0A0L6W2A2_9FIRM|nr:glycosyltransferase [Thermincola ferriacetica]KNZ69670.1 monogalactosyldiacylglycerol synthase [Thermincola ferriacetica]
MKNLRVLVFSATFGAGHVRAAEAVIEAIHIREPYAMVTHLDCGEFLSKTFNNVIKNVYIGMIKYSPKLWGKFYYGTAKVSPDSLIQRFLNQMGQKDFEKLICSLQPDLIICTYPTVAGVISQLKLKHRLNVPLVTVITDYVVHSQWIHPGVDMYIVGCKEVFDGLVLRGIDPARIKVTGIPVSPRFERYLNRAEIISRLGLCPGQPTLLIMGGVYGVLDSLKDVCKLFAESEFPVQSIVVCGKDDKLYKSIDEIVDKARNPIVRLGFVSNVEELMSAADLIITKAGGLTVSEALTKRLPLVIYRPIPGQEEGNAVFLRKIGAGKTAESLEELGHIVHFLLKHPEELERMRNKAQNAIPGRAAERAVEHMLDLVNEMKIKTVIG